MFRSFFSLAALALLFLGLVSANDETLTKRLVKNYKANTLKRLPTTGNCTAKNIVVRKEWYTSHLSHLWVTISPSRLAKALYIQSTY